MKRSTVTAVVLSLFVVGFALSQSGFLIVSGKPAGKDAVKKIVQPRAQISARLPIHPTGNEKTASTLALREELEMAFSYSGPQSKKAIETGDARALSLAAGDLDEDGVPDLVSGYASDEANLLVIHRGNVDAIYGDTPEANERKAKGEFTDAPFLSQAQVFEVPERPDVIGTGDFNADGHRDMVVAALGSQRLYRLAGDGKGGLGEPQAIDLPGKVTAMTVGEINRSDGLDDVVVGITDAAENQILVYESADGAFKSEPEALTLPGAANSFALGQLDDGYEMDLAVAAGTDLVIVHGRDRRTSLDQEARSEVLPAQVDAQSMSFPITSLAIGRFVADHQNEIALLSADGVLHVVERRSDGERWGTIMADGATGVSTDLNRCSLDVARTSACAAPALVRARVSVSGKDDLVVVNQAEHQLQIIVADESALAKAGKGRVPATPILHVAASLDMGSDPVAVLPMRLNIDAFSDLVILKNSGESALAVALTAPLRTFTVNSPGDQNDINPGDNKCETAANNNVCTLRAALGEVNAGPGGDAINFIITSIPSKGIGLAITKAVTIDGGSNRVEISGGGSVSGEAFAVRTGNCTFRGLVLNQLPTTAIDLEGTSGNNFVEGTYIGTDVSGSNASFGTSTSWNGISIGGSFGNSPNSTIGGTAAAARNVISVPSLGIAISSLSAGNKVQGNYIGTDASGTRAFGGNSGGVSANSPNTTIGGTAVGAGNLISCASTGLCTNVAIGGSGILVQGNLIGTDINGTIALNSVRSLGVQVGGGLSGNTIGGTTLAARNIISGNTFSSGYGIGVSSPTLIQGNYIGTNRSGTAAIGNTIGINISSSVGGTTIGGATAGARNVISGNSSTAINIGGGNNVVQGNFIGTDFNGTADLGNGNGVIVNGDNNQIGGTGTDTDTANIIAFTRANSGGTQGSGVRIFQGTGNSVRRNSIFGNAKQAILSDANSADKAPVLSGTTGTLTGARATTAFTIEFFSNPSCGASGTQQATSYIAGGDATFTTNPSGNATFNVPAGQNVTATANLTGQNTSSTSNCVAGAATPTPTPTPSPQIGLSTTPLNFNGFAGQANPPSQTLTLTNTGGGLLNWQASAGTTSGGNWLNVAPATASTPLGPGQSTTLTVSVNTGNLFSDLYTGSITVTATGASNSPRTVAVNFILGCPAQRPEGADGNFSPDEGGCTNTNDPSPNGANVSELGLRENGVSQQVGYLLRSKKKADLVVRVFDQNDNRVGSSPTKSIVRPPSDPIPVPTIETFFVPNEIQSNNCHALGNTDTTCGNSISLFPNSTSLYAQSLMIDPDNGNIISRSGKIPYNIVPFKVELGTDDYISPGSFQPLDPSSVLVSGSSLTESLNLTLQSLRNPVIRVTSGLEDVNHTDAYKDTLLGEKSRTNGNCQPDDRYVRNPRVITRSIYNEPNAKPEAFFLGGSAWTSGVVPDDVDIVELRFGIVLADGLSALSEPVYLPVERIKVRSTNPNVSNAILTPGNLQEFIYKVEYNVSRPGTSMITARAQSITNSILPVEEIALATKDSDDTGCQEFTFDVQLPEDTKIFKLDFQIKPQNQSPVRATSRTSTYLKFGNAIDVPAGPLNTLTGLGVDIKTSKNLIRRAIQQGRNLSDPVFLFKLASRFIPSPSPGGSANREVSGRPQDLSTDVPDLIAINTYWTFDPPIPDDGTFAADLTFHYNATDLPDDPNFNEANLKVVSFDPATGTLTSYPTTLDLVNKTATAHVENLAPVYSLAVFGPFSKSTLDFPVFQSLTNFNTEVTLVNPSPTAAVLNSQSFDPAGTPFGGAGVTNPSSMTLASGQQLSGPATQLFNMSSTEIAGWIQTRSNNNRVLGYELFGSGDRLDGLDIPQTRSTTVVLPDIEFNSNYTTEVHLANASNFSSNLTVELHSANGTVAGTYETSLAAKGQLIKNFDQMFPSIAKPFTGYIVVRSDQQMSAAELFVSNAELVALNAQPLVNAVSTPSTLYAARLVSDGSTIATRINLVNPTASNATVTLRSSDKNGSALAAPVNITLVAGQQYQRDIAQVFGFTPGLLTQGSLSVESSMTGLTGDVIYSDPAGTKPFRTGLALDDASTKPATFARVENGAGRFTEVYISNPNTQAAAVELAVFRPDGSQTGVKNIQVPAGGAVADQLGNLVPASIGQSGGYFVVSANQRVSAGAAFGTLNKTMLAAIPAQRLTTARKAISDFDGDGKSDLAVWREASGIWFVNASGNTPVTPFQFGAPGDVIIPGDYDGDGKADFAVWRQSSGLWYLQRSTAGFSVTQWGVSTDVPVPGDYDGDGKTDIAVWRPSSGIWFIINSSTGQVTATQWGVPTDKLVPGDYDGDGRTDLAVWRPSSGIWFIVQSSLGGTAFQFGAPTDKVIPADYDGDGKTDIAVYREGPQSLWYLQQSAAGFNVTQWGTTGDIPVPGDYDGDGKADRTVWRPSNGIWFEQQSTSGFLAVQYGQQGDKLIPAAYLPAQ